MLRLFGRSALIAQKLKRDWTIGLEKAKGISQVVMKLRTRVFDFHNGTYTNLTRLAQAMGISVSQIYRVQQGKRPINQKFIIGAMRAFPGHKFDDLFYVVKDKIGDGQRF